MLFLWLMLVHTWTAFAMTQQEIESILEIQEKKVDEYIPQVKKALGIITQQKEKYKADLTESYTPSTPTTPGNSKSHAKKRQTFKHCTLFVSSSIPVNTLRAYAEQADELFEKEGIFITFSLIGGISGLGRIGPTVNWGLSILASNPEKCPSDCRLYRAEIVVDPFPFRENRINLVPALKCDSKDTLVKGDAPLEFLLQRMDAGDPGPFGATYKVIEPDALDEITAGLKNLDMGRISAVFTQKIQNYHFSGPRLPSVSKRRTEYIDISSEAPFDIYDHKGELLYHQGFSYNPLKYIPWLPDMLIIDGEDKCQIELAKRYLTERPALAIYSVSGSPFEIAGQLNHPVADASPVIQKFNLKYIPAMLSKENERLKVTYFPGCLK